MENFLWSVTSVTSLHFQISKTTHVKAVLRNLHMPRQRRPMREWSQARRITRRQADKSPCSTAGNLRAMVMQRDQSRLLSLSFRCGLMLLVLTPLADAASAQSKSSPSEAKFAPSEEYPGPWREVTQEVRDFLTLHKVYACNQACGTSIVV